MPPHLSEDDIDDLLYLARAGEAAALQETLSALAARSAASPAEILATARDGAQATCLHMATGNGNLEIVTLLLSHFSAAAGGDAPPACRQAFLDAPNACGNTALHWAALGGHLAVVRALCAAGARSALANGDGAVPMDLASFADNTHVVDFFLAQVGGLEGGHGAEGLAGAVGAVELGGGEEDEMERGAESAAEERQASGAL